MLSDRFEKLLETKKGELEKAVFSIPLGDTHRFAMFQGKYEMLSNIIDEYRKHQKSNDPEGDET